jgi:predicted ArsR family transcriptional regulator
MVSHRLSEERGEQIDQGILGYLAEQDWPVTTEMVAGELGVSWNTAQMHLYKLVAEGSVKGKRVGRQNQWVIIREKGFRKPESAAKPRDRLSN